MCRFIHSNCIPIGDQQLSQSLTVRVVVAFEADIQVIDDVDRVAIACDAILDIRQVVKERGRDCLRTGTVISATIDEDVPIVTRANTNSSSWLD